MTIPFGIPPERKSLPETDRGQTDLAILCPRPIPRPASLRHRRPGFSLIEWCFATTVFLTLCGTIFLISQRLRQTSNEISRTAQLDSLLNTVQELMRADMATALQISGPSTETLNSPASWQTLILKVPTDPSHYGGPTETITWTLSPRPLAIIRVGQGLEKRFPMHDLVPRDASCQFRVRFLKPDQAGFPMKETMPDQASQLEWTIIIQKPKGPPTERSFQFPLPSRQGDQPLRWGLPKELR